MSYGIKLQPLPPNTGISLVANVAGTTDANNAFWIEKCKTIPAEAEFITVAVGAVRDFFKPIEGSTYCEMLQAHNKHRWSHDGMTWTTPAYYISEEKKNGGSEKDWPRAKGRVGDERVYLSFWGHDGDGTNGGCCSSSTAVGTTRGSAPVNGKYETWGQMCK